MSKRVELPWWEELFPDALFCCDETLDLCYDLLEDPIEEDIKDGFLSFPSDGCEL